MQVTTEQRKRQHAQTYKVAERNVSVVRFELQRLRDEGALVDIEVTGISMLSAGIRWEELGIGESDVRRSRFGRGRKHLFPQKVAGKLSSLESRIRANLEKYSFIVTGFTPYRWVPVGAYFKWREEHDALVEEFEAAKQALLDEYDAAQEALAQDFATIAHQAYTALCATADNDIEMSRAQYVDEVIEIALAKLPSKERITHELRVDYKTAILEDTADIEARIAALEQERIEYEKAMTERHAEQQKRSTRENEERLKRRKMEEMHRMELEKAREQLDSMRSPWDEVVGAFHGQIAQEVQEILGVMNKHGFVPGQTARRIKGLREMYDLLAVQRDEDIETALSQIEASLVAKPKKHRVKGEHAYDASIVEMALHSLVDAVSDNKGDAARVDEWTALELE